MLTQNDLQSIRQVTKKVVDDAIQQDAKKIINDAIQQGTKSIIDNAFDEFAARTINPAFQAVQDQINGVEGKVNGIQGQMTGLQGQMNELKTEVQKRPTIAQIDVKLDNMEMRLREDLGEKPLARDRVLNRKTDTVAGKLGDKALFTPAEVREIEKISPLAVSPLG